MAQSLSAAAVLPLAISALAVLGTLRWLCATWRFENPLASKVATSKAAYRTRFLRNMVQMRMISEVSPQFRKKLQQFLNKYKHGMDMDAMTMCWTAVHNQKIVGVVFVKQMLWTLQDHLQNLPQASVEMQGGRRDAMFSTWTSARFSTMWDCLPTEDFEHRITHTWNVRALLVDENFRKKGFGRMLMEEVIADACACENIQCLELHVDKQPFDKHACLVRWYKALGFQTAHVRRNDLHMVRFTAD